MKNQPEMIDANGQFGRNVNSEPLYPKAGDYLRHLSRLGVRRGIAWHAAAVSHHALSANRSMLAEILKTPGARARLIPALTVSPPMLYERGGITDLRSMMTGHPTRALHFKQNFGHTLRQLEPLLARLADLRPVLFMQSGDFRPEELLDVAASRPETHFVIRGIMWGGMAQGFDYLRRRANVILDSSRLHTWNALELIVREFGADRVVFGLGGPAHNGAAIGALMQAQIPDGARAAIAGGTLERLLGLAPVRRAAPMRDRCGMFWKRLLAGRALGAEVVDAHFHLGGSGGYLLETNDLGEQIEASAAMARRLGIGLVIASGMEALLSEDPLGGNRLLAKALLPHRGRFAAYFGYNPRFGNVLAPALERMMPGFAGFKTLCGYWGVSLDDKRFAPMWEYAERRRLPILNHTWDGGGDSPRILRDVVRKYPNATFLIGHSGGGDAGRAEAVELARENPNVMLEWCGSFCSNVPWEKTLKQVGASRVVYGSDAYPHGVGWELGRLLSLNVPDSQIKPILGANMRRILARRRMG